MKKMWIKKENIYHKPFYKQKLKMTMLIVFIIGLVFLAYQIFYMNQLVMSTVPHILSTQSIVGSSLKPVGQHHQLAAGDMTEANGKVRGIRLEDAEAYKKTDSEQFRCLQSGQLISYKRVNDDFCDCPDASDEPGTNACPNGVFYCSHRLRHPRASGHDRQAKIPNSRINDGICDCCDGSDEWLAIRNSDHKPIKCPQRCTRNSGE